jgi:hypothetical protein
VLTLEAAACTRSQTTATGVCSFDRRLTGSRRLPARHLGVEHATGTSTDWWRRSSGFLSSTGPPGGAPRCTESGRWSHSADRCCSDAGVDSLSVVVVQPGCKCGGAVVVAGEDTAVGPFGGEGAVETFDLAVGPGAVRFDEALLGAECADGVLEVGGEPLGERVV